MKNIWTGVLSLLVLAFVLGCGCRPELLGGNGANNATPAPPLPTNSTPVLSPPAAPKKAYRIKGSIDDAVQEGDVCDASKPFTVPGTLEFEFTPKTSTTGQYTYSGPFNATGSGPYEIRPDGSMLVDGTGCIMGKCATYSHEWEAKPIDPATCKAGKS
ncbi:MAG: hypothetical protein ABIR33_12215 [Pyrinomonadaceae bacterium]